MYTKRHPAPGPWPGGDYILLYILLLLYKLLETSSSFLGRPARRRPRASGSADSKGCAHYRRPREKDQGRARVGFRMSLDAHSPTRPKKNMFTWRCVKTPRNSVSADGPITTVKSKCSRRCCAYVSLTFGFVIFGGGVKWTGVKWFEMN